VHITDPEQPPTRCHTIGDHLADSTDPRPDRPRAADEQDLLLAKLPRVTVGNVDLVVLERGES
jgi:hypothetical protein